MSDAVTAHWRVTIIRQRMAELMRTVPGNFQDWSADRAREFKKACQDFNGAGTIRTITERGQRLAAFYGAPWVTIDPEAGA